MHFGCSVAAERSEGDRSVNLDKLGKIEMDRSEAREASSTAGQPFLKDGKGAFGEAEGAAKRVRTFWNII